MNHNLNWLKCKYISQRRFFFRCLFVPSLDRIIWTCWSMSINEHCRDLMGDSNGIVIDTVVAGSISMNCWIIFNETKGEAFLQIRLEVSVLCIYCQTVTTTSFIYSVVSSPAHQCTSYLHYMINSLIFTSWRYPKISFI